VAGMGWTLLGAVRRIDGRRLDGFHVNVVG
jgi:hypothetical protein